METDKIHSFDSLFTTDHIRILKIFLSYLSPPMQGQLAVIIRFGELLCTMRFFEKNPYAGWSAAGSSTFAATADQSAFSADGLYDLLNEIFPYCDDAEQERIRNLQNTCRNVENIRQTMEMFEIIQQMMPEYFQQDAEAGTSGNSPFGFDLSGLSQMMDMMRELNPSPK